MKKEQIEEKLKTFLEKETKKKITHRTDLIKKGIIDSFLMFKFIAFTEKEFNLKVDIAQITPNNFNTLDKIVKKIILWK